MSKEEPPATRGNGVFAKTGIGPLSNFENRIFYPHYLVIDIRFNGVNFQMPPN